MKEQNSFSRQIVSDSSLVVTSAVIGASMSPIINAYVENPKLRMLVWVILYIALVFCLVMIERWLHYGFKKH